MGNESGKAERRPHDEGQAYAAALRRYPVLRVATVHQAIEAAQLLDELAAHDRAFLLRWIEYGSPTAMPTRPQSVAKQRQELRWRLESLRRNRFSVARDAARAGREDTQTR